MSALRLLAPDTLRTQPWANGAGTTTVIASDPDHADWRWRLSIADIAQDGAFSAFPATRRQFVALDAPITLRFSNQRELALLRLSVTHFDGADAPYAQLPDGPTRAFNLMLRGDAQGELMARPLNGSMWLPVREGWLWFVHVLGGRADMQVGDEHVALEMGANVWIDAAAGQRTRIEGGGELILVQLSKNTA
ncbi:HutD/Ves family protein [Dyella acidiphila]|uniref:HutD family protein n=1 Tax=Dyella acidiphila TaxID=2775866 RepID=A0ABR9G7T1_9GAMM|nr:HutD family protein [Dyella acidiphila]MBE1160085.1 HutD family protein [Dyella acidiphila]